MAILGFEEKEFFSSGHRACAGCGEAIALRHVLKAAGEKTIVVQATGCMEVVSTPYPETSWEVPWVHCAFENAAAVASGVRAALNMKGDKETKVVAMGGDGATYDIGFGSLSGAFERGTNFLYVCTNNEAYMNTGIQRSGATPEYTATTTTPAGKIINGKQGVKKPLPFILAAHGAKYVATASVTNLFDLKKKVQKALSINGPTYIEVLVPCVPGWKIDASATLDVAKKAFETNAFPLFEIENGVLTITSKPEQKKPIHEYLTIQGRYKHLNPEQMEHIQKGIDEHFTYLESIQGKKIFETLL